MSDCRSVAMPISQTKMNLEGCGKISGPLRPLTLFLDEDLSRDDMGYNGGSVIGIPSRRKKKKCRASDAVVKKFADIYETTGESLGEGSFGQVTTYRNINTRQEFAVKVIKLSVTKSRHRVLKEIEIFHHCQGHENILQMIEYFEEDNKFYLVFEKMEGGTLLDSILQRGHLSEQEASSVVRDIASGLNFLHKKGIAHRDLKPENILCVKAGQLTPVKICDFDLGSGIQIQSRRCSPVTTPELLSPVGSADFMAPEVVDVWQYQAESYDKRCDLWSLGTILYILLCGYRPFYAHCGRDCGFDEGGDCEDCQELLFKCIQQGVYSFPDPDWSDISYDAKDLIQHLLVKNPYQRYSAEQVLRHPWLCKDLSAAAPLATPFILSRNNSVRELGVYAETANAVNRLIQRHLSMNEFSTAGTPSLLRACHDDDHTGAGHSASLIHGMFKLSTLDDDDDDGLGPDGGLGRWSEDEDDDEVKRSYWEEEVSDSDGLGDTEEVLAECKRVAMRMLSSPGSSLAKRRAFRNQQLSECSVDSGTVSNSSSPPDYCPSTATRS